MITNLSIAAWHDDRSLVRCDHQPDMLDNQTCCVVIGDCRQYVTPETLARVHKATGELLSKLHGAGENLANVPGGPNYVPETTAAT